MDEIIFGINPLTHVVSCEVKDDILTIFRETEPGKITQMNYPAVFWLLASDQLDVGFKPLEGEQHFKYLKTYSKERFWSGERKKYKYCDVYSIWNKKEASMVSRGFTYFKGMKVNDVSVLSFDIETIGLLNSPQKKVLLISNTYRAGDKIIRKLFAFDDFKHDKDMFDAWSKWIRDLDPSVMIAHNGVAFDLPYMIQCAHLAGTQLYIGRDGSAAYADNYESDFRLDQTQSLKYCKHHVFGREIIDTHFLARKYDLAKKYDNYRLKSIIKTEKLEKSDRIHYDASKIRVNYTIPEEWDKIKTYCEDDSDDALALFDLMIPSTFYFNQSVPKSFQDMSLSATGSQLNAIMVRSYLQTGHSIPKASPTFKFEGATSGGIPGIYQNVLKIDVRSEYPSCILQYEIYDREKDPKAHFLHMVQYFTDERIKNKRLAKETKDKYYKDLEAAQKVGINSAFGLLGTTGLNFNSPVNAALVTEKGRNIIEMAMLWATGKDLKYWKQVQEKKLK